MTRKENNCETVDISFEDALAELERIVRVLDAGQTSLEASLRDYEKGIQLLRHCHATLQNAERRIEILKNVNPDGTFVTEIAPESQFLTDTAQPGQRRGTEIEQPRPDGEKLPPVRKKRVRKTVREDDFSESDEIPFDFD
jgi:exodeoxyribonuclease VII small subunit